MELSSVTLAPAGLGVDRAAHAVPFHASARPAIGVVVVAYPTASQALAAVQETAVKVFGCRVDDV
jgi:hypothetical protein